MAVGSVLDQHKMAKHFEPTISEAHLIYRLRTNQIADEAALDGLYGVRTSLPKEAFEDARTVSAHKSLSRVERAFRCLKTVDLHVRPIYHGLEEESCVMSLNSPDSRHCAKLLLLVLG